MATQHVLYNEDAQAKLVEGVNILANAVKVSMGPRGRTVILQVDADKPIVATKDGVTIAKSINVQDPDVNAGILLARASSEKAMDNAGDGTTAALVLTQELIAQGQRYIGKGVNVAGICSGITKTRDKVIEEIKALASPVDTLELKRQIATVSANGDSELGDIVSEAFEKAGTDGVVKVVDSKAISGCTVEYVHGLRFKRGLMSEYFRTEPDKNEANYEKAAILVSTKKLLSANPITKVLNYCLQQGRPLVIIADDIDNSVLSVLVQNRIYNQLKVVTVRAPGFGDQRKALLADIACYTGATLIDDESGLDFEDVDPMAHLGLCASINITNSETTISGCNNDSPELQARIAELRAFLADHEAGYDHDKAKERLANLTTGIATISVGGISEEERKERKDRLDDAVWAVRCATQEGFVPGGGNTLLYIAKKLEQPDAFKELNLTDDEAFGAKILLTALKAPFKTILDNANIEWGLVYNEVGADAATGYDARALKVTNLIDAGIIDPAKVVRSSMSCAVSVATTILTAGAMATYNKEEPKWNLPPLPLR